jgi:hypothetical protein
MSSIADFQHNITQHGYRENQLIQQRDECKANDHNPKAPHKNKANMSFPSASDPKSKERILRPNQIRLINLLKNMHIWEIFSFQEFQEEDVYWFGALMGRMIAQKDKLEAAPFLRGVAGTGKSTILKLILSMLDPVDVTLIQDDGRKGFADQHIIGKRIVAAMDIGSKPNFSKTRLNSYISKEPMLSDVMYKDSVTQMETNTNWMLAGNGEPPWSDLSGCIARRLIIFLFKNMIDKSNTNLFDNCLTELPKLLVIFQFMYIDMTETLSGRTLWDKDAEDRNIMSNMMHKTRQSFLVSSSSLSAFLEDADWCINHKTDEKQEVSADDTVTQSNFNKAFSKYCKMNGVKHDKRTINVIEDVPILKIFGIKIQDGEKAQNAKLTGVKLGNLAGN